METILMFSLVLLFGIASFFSRSHQNKPMGTIFFILLLLATSYLIIYAVMDEENRYLAILFSIFGFHLLLWK
ncbi:MAG: hypothetical protein FJ213_01615 [Ignavibacteria bacterium]|nr:hypothetical protein [Ignavibacteria bacterium]